MQAAYRAVNSTETALIRVNNDLLNYIDKKHMAALVLLDLSAAFDTIDHSVLLQRLKNKFGFNGTALLWIESYLSNRTQSVKIGQFSSPKTVLSFGVPQGSVLGPLLFTLYVSPIGDICDNHNLDKMFYADDSQMYMGFDPKQFSQSSFQSLEQCVAEIKTWMEQNYLKLNDSKTELLLLGSTHQHKICNEISITVGESNINSSDCVRNLGAYFDKYLLMDEFISKKLCCLQIELRKIRRIRKYLTTSATKTLIQSLFISRLDYASCLLLGVAKYKIDQLQKLQNTAARIILNKDRSHNAHSLLYELHWLPVHIRINFRCLVYVYKCLNGLAPDYMSELIIPVVNEKHLRSSDKVLLYQPRTRTTYGDRAFSNYGPKLWNKLPKYIQCASSQNQFRKLLKTFFFSDYFCDISVQRLEQS